MSLGQNIYSQRTAHNMSQGDLADKLDVSRQSISKWETDTSVPELDKLLRMSDIFGLTLDELVKGEAPANSPAVQAADPGKFTAWLQNNRRLILRFAAGFICLIIAVNCLALACFVAGKPIFVTMAITLAACALICFITAGHTLFFCLAAVFIAANIHCGIFHDSAWMVILHKVFYTGVRLRTHLYIGWGLLAAMWAMLAYCLWTFRKLQLPATGLAAAALCLGWFICLGWIGCSIDASFGVTGGYDGVTAFYSDRAVYFTLQHILFSAMLTLSLAALRGKAKRKPSPPHSDTNK